MRKAAPAIMTKRSTYGIQLLRTFSNSAASRLPTASAFRCHFQEELLQRALARLKLPEVYLLLSERAADRGRPLAGRFDYEAVSVACNPADAVQTADDALRPLVVRRRDLHRFAAAHERSDGTLGNKPPLLDDRDVVAHLLDLVQEVGRHEHGLAGRSHLPDQSAELAHAGGIEAVRGFVEYQQLRVVK